MDLQKHSAANKPSTPAPNLNTQVEGSSFQTSKASPAPQIKPIQIHHLDPGRDEVLHKLLLRIRAGIDLGQCPQLGVGAEDQVDAGAGPFDLAGLAVAGFELLLGVGQRFPFHAHVQQVDEEVVAQRARAQGEDAVGGMADVDVEHAQAADQRGHFRCGEGQQLGLVHQQGLGGYAVVALEIVTETIGDRFEVSEGLDVRLILAGIRAARGERHSDIEPGIFRRQFDAGAAGQHDQVGQGDFLAAGLRAVEVALNVFQGLQHRRQLRRLVGRPVLLRASRRRPPLAPPRLSEPRKLEAAAQAVDTSWDTDRPEANSLLLRVATSP